MELLVATTNEGKLRELRAMLDGLPFTLVTARSLGISAEVEEDRDTFEGNARKKAETLARRSGRAALADDSGLEVDALDGEPGVRSARYAGEGATDAANVAKVLDALRGSSDRAARFRCVLALAWPSGEVAFVANGTCEGTITEVARGSGGFGYDPVFVPVGESRTMAELSPEEKNARSHRGVAMRAMRAYLESVSRAQQ